MPKFEGKSPSPDRGPSRENPEQVFFEACRLIKLSVLPEWMPPFHPSKALTATPEEKRAFAESIARAYEQKNGHKIYVKKMGEVFGGDTGDLEFRRIFGALGLVDEFRHVEQRDPPIFASPADIAHIQRRAEERERASNQKQRIENRKHADMFEACEGLIYADVISSTDLGRQYAEQDPNDRKAAETFSVRLDAEIRERAGRYPLVADLVKNMNRENGPGKGEQALFMAMLSRLRKDYPRKPKEEKGFMAKLFGKKEEPVPFEQHHFGPAVIEAAINAVAVDYSHNQYTSVGASARPIREMSMGLMQNDQALETLTEQGIFDPNARPEENITSVRQYIFDELRRRGIKA